MRSIVKSTVTPSLPFTLSEFTGSTLSLSSNGEEESVPYVEVDCEVSTSELKATSDSSPVMVLVRSKQTLS